MHHALGKSHFCSYSTISPFPCDPIKSKEKNIHYFCKRCRSEDSVSSQRFGGFDNVERRCRQDEKMGLRIRKGSPFMEKLLCMNESIQIKSHYPDCCITDVIGCVTMGYTARRIREYIGVKNFYFHPVVKNAVCIREKTI